MANMPRKEDNADVDITSLIISHNPQFSTFQISLTFIRFVADKLGFGVFTEEVARLVSRLVTYKLSSIILDAKKYAMMSKRSRIIGADIDNALITRGFTSFILNESVYSSKNIGKVQNPVRGFPEIHFFNDSEIDVDDYMIDLKNKIKAPYSDIGIKAHWLALNGVQPSLPENPFSLPQQEANQIDRPEESLPLSLHLQLYYKELTEASIGTLEDKRKDALSLLQRDPSVRHLILPLCSFIYQGIRVNTASKNLALLIYIMRMVCSIIQNSSIPLHILESHFSEIIPSILSCILSPELCSKQFEENHWALRIYSSKLICNLCTNFDSTVPHLRQNIIDLLKSSLKQSIKSTKFNEDNTKIFIDGIEIPPQKFPYGTHFGAFYTFSLFTLETSRIHLLPIAHELSQMYKSLNAYCSLQSEEFKRDILKTESVLLQIFSLFLKKDGITELSRVEETVGKYFAHAILNLKLL